MIVEYVCAINSEDYCDCQSLNLYSQTLLVFAYFEVSVLIAEGPLVNPDSSRLSAAKYTLQGQGPSLIWQPHWSDGRA